MDVITAIKGRRSVRSFTDEPVDKETLIKLLEAAVWAPSGGNGQTWRFVVVTEKSMMNKIKMVSPGLLGDPQAVIVIAQDTDLARHKGGKMGVEAIIKMDSAMAAQNIMLAAYEMGLGTCVIASFHPGAVAKLLGMPAHVIPQLLVSIGHPAKIPPPPERLFDGIYWFEAYDG
ncbi:MAG: nitroreductase family protein [Deltaproteobacteria bacterium]|nr:nitroreductase family protein [Deltaproteobacteria bacterium]